MDDEEYKWTKKELLKNKSLPYMFSHEEYANDFFRRILKEYPAASIHYWKIHQWICLNDRARANLREKMIEWSSSLSLELSELCANIEALKKGERNE